MSLLREGTIVKFRDGRVAVKKLFGTWEVSGTTMLRYRDSDLDEGYAVVYTPPKDVSGYGLGTILRIGEDPYMKTGHSTPGGGYWQCVSGNDLSDVQVEASDFIELFVGGK